MELRINHRIGNGIVDVIYFNDFDIDLKFDSIASTYSFKALFDPYNRVHAELYCVSHFHEATLIHEKETLISGFLLSQAFSHSSVKEMSQLAGYSKPGVLEDCEIPPSIYPLQSDGLTFAEIVNKLVDPFHLDVVIDSEVSSIMNKVIPKSTASETQNIKSYLTELAVQRNINMTHTPEGALLFTKAKTKLKPIVHFEEGTPGTSFKMSFNGQNIHSHITVIKQASDDGGNAGEYTIKNPYCPVAYVYRPKVVTQSSGDDITIEEYAKQQLANELKNIKFVINTDRWKIDGKIIRPNNIVTIFCPEIFVYKKIELFIESVKLKGDSESTTAELVCVLPEVYNGEIPLNVFVDSHANFPRLKRP